MNLHKPIEVSFIWKTEKPWSDWTALNQFNAYAWIKNRRIERSKNNIDITEREPITLKYCNACGNNTLLLET